MLEELLDLILSNLFANDRHSFGLVCGSWSKVLASRHSPCLILTNRTSNIWKVFQHNVLFSMNFPDKNAVIRCSKYGWLLMSRDDESLFFFDPCNNRRIEVPVSSSYYSTVSFFHQPTSPDCFIIGISSVIGCHLNIGLLKHGENEWKNDQMFHISTRIRFQASLAAPILHGEKLYFLDVRGKVTTIGMSKYPIIESGYIFKKCFKQRRLRRNITEHYLIKPRDEDVIYAVFVVHDDRKVKVYKLLELDMSWEPIEDLGDKVFYVSSALSFGYTTTNTSMANKIFFPKFHDEKVVFYCLNTKQYHSFGGDGNYSRENSYDLERFDHATWMTPGPTSQSSGELLRWYGEDPQEDHIVS